MPKDSKAVGAGPDQISLAHGRSNPSWFQSAFIQRETSCGRLARNLVPGARAASAGLFIMILLVLTACRKDAPEKRGALTLPVDSRLVPAQSMIGPRPVARMVGDSGIAMDFFLGELIVVTDDQAKLDAVLARWGGTVLTSTDRVGDVARIHHVKLDPSKAVVARLLADLNAKAPDLRGSFRSSSDAAAKLLAVALSEANGGGMMVTPNFVVPRAGIREGITSEAPTGDDGLYDSNVFAWPYMSRGSAQDTGVGAAWQAMQRAGVFRNKVRIMVLDGGFSPNADFPTARGVIGDWNVPNPGNCGGSPCPWHGSMVTSAAMGTVDDGLGTAGPAAPVAELLAVPFETDFFALMFTLERVITATAFGNPRIINISAGFELDLGWEIAVKASCLGLCPAPGELFSSITALVSGTNKLIFASAGNQRKDVDNGGSSPEGSLFIPCELFGVICVGGMAHNSIALDPGSNFGSKTNDDSVDIYGPFWTWVSDPAFLGNHARLKSGTSFSSPFVAGVAALVWASKPDLSAGQVWEILRETAHVGGVHSSGGHQRRVNAFGAVARVLGGRPPTIVLNASAPRAPLHRQWSVTAVVTDDGSLCSPLACPLTWDPLPARDSGNLALYRFGEVGVQTITVTARDAVDQSVTARTTVEVVNSPPVVTISVPSTGTSVAQGVLLDFNGSATDVNEGPDPGPGLLPCNWTSSNLSDVGFPRTACVFSAAFTSMGRRTLTLTATDSTGSVTRASVAVNVAAPPANFPPVLTSGSLPPPNFNGDTGYAWDFNFPLTSSATDPEGNNPITYEWKATSFRPNSSNIVFRNNVMIGMAEDLVWSPSSTPSLMGTFADFGSACYDGQIVRIWVEATDSLGNRSTKTLPDIKVYRCILI